MHYGFMNLILLYSGLFTKVNTSCSCTEYGTYQTGLCRVYLNVLQLMSTCVAVILKCY